MLALAVEDAVQLSPQQQGEGHQVGGQEHDDDAAEDTIDHVVIAEVAHVEAETSSDQCPLGKKQERSRQDVKPAQAHIGRHPIDDGCRHQCAKTPVVCRSNPARDGACIDSAQWRSSQISTCSLKTMRLERNTRESPRLMIRTIDRKRRSQKVRSSEVP